MLAGCWAHVFRKVQEAEPDHAEANLAMGWLGELYAIDERAGDDVERRRTDSTAVLDELKTRLWIGKASPSAIAERVNDFEPLGVESSAEG